MSFVMWCTLHNHITGLCLAETRAKNLTFGWSLDKHLHYGLSFLFRHQQTGMDLAEMQASSSNHLYGVSVFHFCLSTIYIPYSHIHTDLGLLATWVKVWTEKKQHPLLLTVKLTIKWSSNCYKWSSCPLIKKLHICAAGNWKSFFGVLPPAVYFKLGNPKPFLKGFFF